MFDDKTNGAKYLQLYKYYKSLIQNGIMKKGEKMPSIRSCSENFELSRTTVENAYDMLCAEGYITAKAQSGFYVSEVDTGRAELIKTFEESTKRKNQSVRFDMVSSIADKAVFNFSLWRRYVKSALRQDERLLSYGEPQGEYDLRQAICSYISKERSVVCMEEQIVIAAGTQSLLGILCALTKERKTVSFVGSEFKQGRAVFEDYGKSIIKYDKTESPMSSTPSMMYISASHADSEGGVLSIKDRMELLDYAKHNDILLVEDDYDSEFRYLSKPVPSIQGMNGGQEVVYIGTFSKLLLPSIRISFMVLPLSLVDDYLKIGGLYNQTASKAEQIALCRYLRDGHLSSQIRKQRKLYSQKTAYVCREAEGFFPKGITFSPCQASYLIKVEVKTGGSKTADEICKDALKNGIRIRPIGTEKGRATVLMSTAGFDINDCTEMFERFLDSLK